MALKLEQKQVMEFASAAENHSQRLALLTKGAGQEQVNEAKPLLRQSPVLLLKTLDGNERVTRGFEPGVFVLDLI